MSPDVSILVPIYNVEKYVVEALESIQRQTFRDFEVIIVDDGSSDNSYSVAHNKFSADSRFKFFKNRENRGIAFTLNEGLHQASGRFIARADGDDIMIDDRLERQMSFLASNPGIGLVGTSYITIDEEGREIGRAIKASGVENIKRILPWGSPISHIWLARREVYDLVGPYRMPTVEDYDFLLRADLAGFLLDNIPEYFGMKVRIRTGNTATTQGLVQAKLHNYALRQYLRGKKGRTSDYDSRFVESLIKSKGGRWAKGHAFSSSLAQKAAMAKGATSVGLNILSAVVSPYRAQYLVRAVVKKRLVAQASRS